jgi:isochorismate synthase EntC
VKPTLDERFASRTEAVARLPRVDPFDAALAVARAGRGLTLIAMRVPAIEPSAIVRAFPDEAVVAWDAPASGATSALTVVGVGCARELRGHGDARWVQLRAAVRALSIHGAVTCDRRRDRPSDTRIAVRDDWSIASPSTLLPVRELGPARPRFLGGAAFAPGAADTGPWAGFGDAWFVLPRWTYVASGDDTWLTLAIDEDDARDVERWRAELAIHDELPRRDLGGEAPPAVDVTRASAELWRAQVEAITSAIGAGACSKIVAARTCTVTLDRDSLRERGPMLDTHTSQQITAALGDTDSVAPMLDARTSRQQIALALRDPLATRSDHAPNTGTSRKQLATTPRNPLAAGAHTPSAHVTAAPLLDTLAERHPESVRVMICPPHAGALVAATPERLVRRDGDTIRCDALAGTIRHAGDPAAAATLLASTKDRREHDLVVRAIRDTLESIGAVIDAPAEPQIRTLRHVLHLHTPFRATASPCPDVLELAARLHPTPAVGGTPTQFAIDWIRHHEPVPRGWYASPVGWFDLDGDGELAVAIRSGVVVGNRVHLWAGAGIVAGSDPDRELAETELKLRAMLGALGVAGRKD